MAVTSFNPEKQPYGLRCLSSLVEFFPGKIVAYVEGDLKFEGVEVRDFFSISGVSGYLKKVERVSGANGETGVGQYDYRFDASKFCRKVFAQDVVFDEDQEVFWFDADCVVLKPIPPQFLSDLIKGVPFAYLGRKNYTETGWVGFNTQHEKFKDFRSKYLSCFTSGKIFSFLEWHDCFAFDYARQGIKGNDLSPKVEAMGHVLLKSVLAPYIDHTKGPKRKKLGYSPGHQYNDPSLRPAVLGDG